MELLAPDVVMVGDGGGKAWALAEPMSGAERVARLLLGLTRRAPKMGVHMEPAYVNGQPGAVTYDTQDRVVNVFALDIADGRVQTIRSILNPDKLHHLGPVSDAALRGGATPD
jgi:RNA polymerase sigma-70 factor (ECF subfamily)